jgi:hypothetical protein
MLKIADVDIVLLLRRCSDMQPGFGNDADILPLLSAGHFDCDSLTMHTLELDI